MTHHLQKQPHAPHDHVFADPIGFVAGEAFMTAPLTVSLHVQRQLGSQVRDRLPWLTGTYRNVQILPTRGLHDQERALAILHFAVPGD